MPLAETHHVVVDGSNLATEGRTLPSLQQLDEAVRAYASEDPGASIIVVVDATFEHRVDDAEREEVRQAMLNGEIISPPAGAIGRGDAFVLRIAERTGATVLSNDSFQEFHGEHPWLFDDGRLIGGKPVPGVGWIFTPRLPIRGPKSRAATAEARAKKDPESAPAKAAELAKAAKKAAKKSPKARKSAAEAGAAGRHLVADHAHGAAPGPGQGQPGVLERHRRGGRGGAASAAAREVPGRRQEERRGQEGGAARSGPRPRRTPPPEGADGRRSQAKADVRSATTAGGTRSSGRRRRRRSTSR